MVELEIHEATSTRRGFDVQTKDGRLLKWNLRTREEAEAFVKKFSTLDIGAWDNTGDNVGVDIRNLQWAVYLNDKVIALFTTCGEAEMYYENILIRGTVRKS